MEQNTENEVFDESNATEMRDDNENTIETDDKNNSDRSFGITDMWSIRRNSRKFKIHNRIPRL